jgi:hypothetical protein
MYTCTGTAARFHYVPTAEMRTDRTVGGSGLKTQRSELPNHNKKQQQQKQESLVCVTTMMDPSPPRLYRFDQKERRIDCCDSLDNGDWI